MTWWLTAHAVPRIGFVAAAALAILVLPPGGATATPSPAGATVAVACFLALAAPVVAAWGCSRGDANLEAIASRPMVIMNLALMLIAVGAFAIGALALAGLGVAGSGWIAGRDALTFAGLALVVQPWAGWRNASIAPAVYLLAVAILGRGADIAHPAAWAWIAADGSDRTSWAISIFLLVAGIIAYLSIPARAPLDGE